MDLRILAWAINEDTHKMERDCSALLSTAERHGVDVELFGLGVKFVEHKQRVDLLRQFLTSESERETTVYVCMDGSDTLFNSDLSSLRERFLSFDTRILISAERAFTYQFEVFRERFESISSPYRYVNAGTFMGYGDSILKMLEEMLEINKRVPVNDQGLMGIWAHQNLFQPKLVKLDTESEVFWVTTEDWDMILDSEQSTTVRNPSTGTAPSIIHGIGGRAKGTRTEDAFRHLYCAILPGKDETV